MRRRLRHLFLMTLVGAAVLAAVAIPFSGRRPAAVASAQDVDIPTKPAESPELLKTGEWVYYYRCSFCL